MIAMFLYPDSTIYEGGKEMLRILETGLPFRAEEYIKGLGISEISDNTGMLAVGLSAKMPQPYAFARPRGCVGYSAKALRGIYSQRDEIQPAQ